ncbi:MAG: tRNA (N(6)-L-threonylcarbamoyladenosine(37)-C(2))-methylthiotransferase MtaB [Bacteroidales bacterium]|jgi:threonylcarbamoyladenosine tRNA methylthiotransferase MtaB|nr:tRNA (N(6)-L-threonylcarbamoyladenosine(37)-C(2))-methylthiotransferase MtaB [Bacteroidales bacterium]
MRILLQTLGCKLNFSETSSLAQALREAGHQTVGKGEEADVCVLNTCSVTDVADQKGRQAIRRLHREHPGVLLIVTGCYAQLQPEQVASIEGVNYVVGANDKEQIISLIEDYKNNRANWSYKPNRLCTDLAAPAGRLSEAGKAFHPSCSKEDRTRCFLKVQDGCDYFCTYCTIPMARGTSRNAPVADTVALAQKAIDEGAKEIVLTGVNIGDFGKSTGETFADLVRALDNVRGEVRYRISSCEPNLLSDDIIDFVAQSRHFAPHFHIPLQSGSNEVLQIMHRRYTRELFAERIARIHSRMPGAFIGVDCMVGVRGETPEMFRDYVYFLEKLEVSQLHVFPYSERANTRMVEMDLPIVPKDEQHRRVDVLLRLSEDKLKAFYLKHRGTQATVLWEGACKGRQMAGWTENYIRITAPYNEKKINTFEKLWI